MIKKEVEFESLFMANLISGLCIRQPTWKVRWGNIGKKAATWLLRLVKTWWGSVRLQLELTRRHVRRMLAQRCRHRRRTVANSNLSLICATQSCWPWHHHCEEELVTQAPMFASFIIGCRNLGQDPFPHGLEQCWSSLCSRTRWHPTWSIPLLTLQ